MQKFITLIRTPNLVIIAFTQLMTMFFLSPPSGRNLSVFTPGFILLILSTMIVAAAGYIINDYLDVKIDMINKPSRVIIGRGIKRRTAMLLHLGMTLFAIAIGLYISYPIAIIMATTSVLLWFYTESFKNRPFAGNLLVAILSSSVILTVWVYEPSLKKETVLAYSFFAFVISLVREIIKDMEDYRGDLLNKCKTLPVVIGIRKTRYLTMVLTSMLALVILSYGTGVIDYISPQMKWYFYIYSLLFIILPLLLVFYRLMNADLKKDFSKLSLYCKLIMMAGIISMIFHY